MTHTPGPWAYDDDTATVDNDLGVAVCGLNVDEIDDATLEANARVISLAPDLLAALKNLCDELEAEFPSDDETTTPARALIAKAEGRNR